MPRKIVVRLTDRPDMTLKFTVDVKQQYNNKNYVRSDVLTKNLDTITSFFICLA